MHSNHHSLQWIFWCQIRVFVSGKIISVMLNMKHLSPKAYTLCAHVLKIITLKWLMPSPTMFYQILILIRHLNTNTWPSGTRISASHPAQSPTHIVFRMEVVHWSAILTNTSTQRTKLAWTLKLMRLVINSVSKTALVTLNFNTSMTTPLWFVEPGTK